MRYFYNENLSLQESIDGYFAQLAACNEEHFDGCLSVILLGSLSRGEATWVEADGEPVMVSDIEFFTVYPDGFTRFEEFDRAIKEAGEKYFFRQNSVLFHVDNTYVCRERLPLMERKLLTFDATRMGKAVVGEDDIPRLPEITLDNINLWDIRDILTHRMFSVLYYGMDLKNRGEDEQYRYCLAKNSLDLMTVLLVMHGILESGFIKRLECIKELAIEESVKRYFTYCLALKLGTECPYDFAVSEMEEMFLALVRDLRLRFRVPLKNTLTNGKFVLRRVLGMCKRAIRYRHLVFGSHLKRLIVKFEEKQPLTGRNLADNLVLNGYPVPKREW